MLWPSDHFQDKLPQGLCVTIQEAFPWLDPSVLGVISLPCAPPPTALHHPSPLPGFSFLLRLLCFRGLSVSPGEGGLHSASCCAHSTCSRARHAVDGNEHLLRERSTFINDPAPQPCAGCRWGHSPNPALRRLTVQVPESDGQNERG